MKSTSSISKEIFDDSILKIMLTLSIRRTDATAKSKSKGYSISESNLSKTHRKTNDTKES